MSEPAKLAIIDDDPAVLDSMAALLGSSGFRAVRTFASAEAFLEARAVGYQPACIVSDVRMAGRSGIELHEELCRQGARIPVIIITGHGQVSMAVKALKAGVADFIEKPFDDEELVGAIRRALAESARHVEDQRARADLLARIDQLSQRQRQVMQLVVRGLSSKEIAVELGISPRTVETYRLWIMEKTGARNLAELVRMAMQAEQVRD